MEQILLQNEGTFGLRNSSEKGWNFQLFYGRDGLTGEGCSAPLEPPAAGPGGKTAAPKGKCTAGEAANGDSSLPRAGETEQHKSEYKKKQCC